MILISCTSFAFFFYINLSKHVTMIKILKTCFQTKQSSETWNVFVFNVAINKCGFVSVYICTVWVTIVLLCAGLQVHIIVTCNEKVSITINTLNFHFICFFTHRELIFIEFNSLKSTFIAMKAYYLLRIFL